MLAALRDDWAWHGWLNYPGRHLRVYMRVVNQRWIDSQIGKRDTMEIANVCVQDRYQCKGWFSGFLRYNEDLARRHSRVLYIEQVLSPTLVNYLARNGYTKVAQDSNKAFGVSMYKILA